MLDEDQVDVNGEAEKIVEIPLEEEEPIEDEIPLLAEDFDEYAKIDAEDLLEPEFMRPNDESSYSMY